VFSRGSDVPHLKGWGPALSIFFGPYTDLHLMFIVWLRFVNHLLNYYLLTYLLTPIGFDQSEVTRGVRAVGV